MNYEIFTCYNILFEINIKDLISNFAFFFGASVLLFNIISCFIFFCYFLPQMRIQIYKLLPKKTCISKEKQKKDETKRNLKKSKTRRLNKKANMIIKRNKRISKTNYYEKRKETKKNDLIRFNQKIKNEVYIKNHNLKTKKKIETDNNNNNNNKDKNMEEKDFNYMAYTKALRLDKRNIFLIYLSILKMKIEIISIFFYPEEFTHKSLTLSIYLLNILFSYFMNALLYTDDIVSQKYHNNGKLDLLTTIFLSLISNIISNIIFNGIKNLSSYKEYLSFMIKDVCKQYSFILVFTKLYKLVKIKVCFYFVISFLISFLSIYYLLIFCQLYKASQISLLINYIMGLIESLIYSISISLIISMMRFIGLKYKKKYIYRTSIYLDEYF